MDKPVTPVQKKILEFVAESIRENGYPPTVREIGEKNGISSPGSVGYHLKILEAKGLLKRIGSISRGLAPAENPFTLPILGRVGAGSGHLAMEEVEGHFSFRNFTLGSDYLLRVKGDSMTGAGIMDGDLVQVRRQPTAREGEIVVALVGEEGVVKRLARRGQAYSLESANPRYRPIIADFQVIGKVMGLVRQYGK